MAGHMGNKYRTIQNLEIIKSDLENNLIFIKGSVPGSKNSFVLIKSPSKTINKITTIEKIRKVQKYLSKSIPITKKDKAVPKEIKSKEKTEKKVEKK